MTAPNNRERILPRLIDDEIKESFINYSMSVIVVARAARRARRTEAGASARAVRDERHGSRAGTSVQEVRDRRRRRARQVSPARRPVGVRRARAHGAGFLAALSARRWPGKLRIGRRRSARRRTGTPKRGSRRSRWRCSPTSTRTPSTSRRTSTTARRADGAPARAAEPDRQRIVGHRRRHGDEHSAAQPARSHQRDHAADRRSRR